VHQHFERAARVIDVTRTRYVVYPQDHCGRPSVFFSVFFFFFWGGGA
jgi:hypothetical protein